MLRVGAMLCGIHDEYRVFFEYMCHASPTLTHFSGDILYSDYLDFWASCFTQLVKEGGNNFVCQYGSGCWSLVSGLMAQLISKQQPDTTILCALPYCLTKSCLTSLLQRYGGFSFF